MYSCGVYSCCLLLQLPHVELPAFELLYSGVIYLSKLYWHYWRALNFFEELWWVTLNHLDSYACFLLEVSVWLWGESCSWDHAFCCMNSLYFRLLHLLSRSLSSCKVLCCISWSYKFLLTPWFPAEDHAPILECLSSLENGWFKTARRFN